MGTRGGNVGPGEGTAAAAAVVVKFAKGEFVRCCCCCWAVTLGDGANGDEAGEVVAVTAAGRAGRGGPVGSNAAWPYDGGGGDVGERGADPTTWSVVTRRGGGGGPGGGAYRKVAEGVDAGAESRLPASAANTRYSYLFRTNRSSSELRSSPESAAGGLCPSSPRWQGVRKTRREDAEWANGPMIRVRKKWDSRVPAFVRVQERVDADIPERAHVLQFGGRTQRTRVRKVISSRARARERSVGRTSTCSRFHVSRVKLFTFETWVPSFLCIEAHCTQRKTPWSHEAHRGFLARQSAHWSLPGSLTRARIWRWYRSAAAALDDIPSA